MKNVMRLTRCSFLIALVCIISLGTLSVSGCAGKTKTTTTTFTTQAGSQTMPTDNTTSVTTQDVVETQSHPRGIVGGLLYTIGQVIIFPFRVIGSLFT
jgi:hypothetical protein